MNLAVPWQRMPRHVKSMLRAFWVTSGHQQPLESRIGPSWMLKAAPGAILLRCGLRLSFSAPEKWMGA